jgi:CHAT domain-containing protein/Tfp pilus assembly protein PilF
LVFIACLCGCGKNRIADTSPAKTYAHARQEFEQGELLGASREADEAYRRFADRPDWSWQFRVLDAEILAWRGLSKDSLSLLDAPLPPSLADSDIAIRKEMVEGLANGFLQRFSEAEKHIAKAEQLAQSRQSKLQGEVSLARGTLLVLQGDPSSAQSSFHRALQDAHHGADPFLEARASGSLGLVSMNQEHFDESIDWYTQSLKVSQSLDARIITEKTLGNMGWNYYKMGDLDNALLFLQQAKEAAQQLSGTKDEMIWTRNIGAVELAQRSYSAAERDYKEAWRLARQLDDKAAAAVCLYSLASVSIQEGKSSEAKEYNREALVLAHEGGDHISELYSLRTDGYIAYSDKNFALAESDFHAVLADKAADNFLRWEAEGGLTGVYVEENRPADAGACFRKEIMTLSASRSSFTREESRLSFLSGAVSFYENYMQFLVSHHREREALEVAEISRAHTLVEGLGFRSSSIAFPIKGFAPGQTAKESNSTIFSYWVGVDHSYLWVITPERVELFTLPRAGEIDQLVQSYRQALLGSRDVLETQNEAGRKLYDLLVAPAAKMIPKGARVTILPDGSLYGLNFETLLVPASQLHYWIEDVDVSYANSLTLLAAGASRHASSTKKLLLVGDPVSPNAEFPKLPQAAAEMTGIENYFPAAERTVFSGAEATPDSYLKSQPADFSYIHFVAHGTASRTSPLDSAVILSRQGDDYKLYARDIIQHPLHADLVTISACHGEGVRTYSGEGLVGLSWAFLRAGAHGVIAALWEVNDNSTPQLMDHLYSEIGKGVPPDAALRDAKLALLHSGGIYRRPFYWAPFELYRGS